MRLLLGEITGKTQIGDPYVAVFVQKDVRRL
jgi:hypothetical protein